MLTSATVGYVGALKSIGPSCKYEGTLAKRAQLTIKARERSPHLTVAERRPKWINLVDKGSESILDPIHLGGDWNSEGRTAFK